VDVSVPGNPATAVGTVADNPVRSYVMDMPDDISISDAIAPRRAAIVVAAGALGLVLAGTVALWAHYGTAIFLETIRAGMAACFG
jgi:hypothetical protein